MSNTKLSGMWEKISIYCLNHDSPVKMEILQNSAVIKTPFFHCKAEPPCANRLNLDDYQGIILKFLDIVSENMFETDFTNYAFDYRGGRQKIHVKVILYTENKIRLGILNRTVLGQ